MHCALFVYIVLLGQVKYVSASLYKEYETDHNEKDGGCTFYQHRGQTFAHARVVVRAELSARTKTEEKYISGRLHKALEKRVNKITRG